MQRSSGAQNHSNPIRFPFEHIGAGGAKHRLPLKTMLLLTGASFASAIGSDAAAACTPIAINAQQTSILCTDNDNDGFATTGDAFDLTVESTATVIDNNVSNSGVIQLWDLDAGNDPQIINDILVDGTIRDDAAQLDSNEDLIIDNTIPPASGVYVEGNVGGNISVGEDARIIVAEHGFEIDGDTGLVGNFTNNGLIVTGENGISVNAIGGHFTNSGTINGAGNGVEILGSVAAITNELGASITAGSDGIHVGASVGGDIENHGTIAAQDRGIYIGDRVAGALTNSGSVTSSGGSAIDLASDVGTVINEVDGEISGRNSGLVVGGDVGGSFLNDGQISSLVGRAVSIDGSVAGNFTNNGTIASTLGTGVFVSDDILGAFDNSGHIGGFDNGVVIDGSTQSFVNGVNGDISSNLKAIKIGTVVDDFHNYGDIEGHQGNAVEIDNIGSDFRNSGIIHGQGSALIVQNDIGGGFRNNTDMTSDLQTAVEIRGNIGGGFINTGEISSGLNGTSGRSGVVVDGNIAGMTINTGLISGDAVSADSAGDGFVISGRSDAFMNSSTGVIEGGLTGLSIGTITSASGFLNNFGTITGGSGSGVEIAAFSGESIFNGPDAVIRGGDYGLELGDIDTQIQGDFSGLIENLGTIEATKGSGDGVSIYGSWTGDIYNDGDVSGGSNGVQVFAEINGDFVNDENGTITSGQQHAVSINGGVNGGFINAGIIQTNIDTATTARNGVNTGNITGMFVNTGDIVASTHGVNIFGTVESGFINTGTITGNAHGLDADNGYGLNIENESGDVFLAENSGTIQGAQGIVTFDGDDTIRNLQGGMITGTAGTAIALGNGANIVENDAGAIVKGAILTGSSADRLANAGTIIGNIDLGQGTNELTNSDGGTIEGDIFGGINEDQFVNAGEFSGNINFGDGVGHILNTETGTINAGSTIHVGEDVFTDDPPSVQFSGFQNNGILSPGGAGNIQTTTTTGHFFQSETGVLSIDVDQVAATADQIIVTGTAELAGAVDLTVQNAEAGQQEYIIVTAAGGLTDNGLGLLALTLNPAVRAQLQAAGGTDLVLKYEVDFAGVDFSSIGGLNDNQQNTYDNISDAFVLAGTANDVHNGLLSLDNVAQYQIALDQLGPEIYGTVETGALFSSREFAASLLSCKQAEGTYAAIAEGQCMWARPQFRHVDRETTAETVGFQENVGSLAGGVQFAVAPNWFVGGGFGYEIGDLNASNGARSDFTRYQGGVSVKYVEGPLLLAASVSGGLSDDDVTREIAFGNFSGTATSDPDTTFVTGQLRAAYLKEFDSFYVKPVLDLSWTSLDREGVTENGAGAANLNVAGATSSYAAISPSVELGKDFALAEGRSLRAFARVGGTYFTDDAHTITADFVDAPAGTGSFTNTTELDQLFGDVEVGATLFGSDRFNLSASYQGRFSANTAINGANLKMEFRF
ncbi:autotransporter domain-containing protein [Roseibium sp. SCP14]|uniref:autotransporter domain-containing protein n=1 Tax=Roseibium sp. SCP14 TaxID=3141375 RepID=UPI00333BE7DB